MNDFKKNIYKSIIEDILPEIGVIVSAKRGISSCLGELCTLNNTVIDISIYTSDGDMADGQTVYADIYLTVPYITGNVIKKTDDIFLFTVDGSGILHLVCITDEGC